MKFFEHMKDMFLHNDYMDIMNLSHSFIKAYDTK